MSEGTNGRDVLLRVAGPSLGQFAIKDVVSDPQLDLWDNSQRLIGRNTGYSSALGMSAVSTFSAYGAFPFLPGANDAALMAQLYPGNYTAQVRSVTGRPGTVVVEIYSPD